MNFKKTPVKIEALMFSKIKAHCVMLDIGLSEWIANSAIATYKNETVRATAKGETNETQQKDEHETNHV